jgi:F0F1-type ATP synthase membrane subunit b/b'
MRNRVIAGIAAVPLMAAAGLWVVGAQQPTDDGARQETERERAEAERERAEAEREAALERAEAQRERAEAEREHVLEQAEAIRERQRALQEHSAETRREMESLERELGRARRELEQSAREVAQLSAQAVNPIMKDFSRRFRYAGQRAMLGVNIEDTERGVRVAGVSPNGPAADAGLEIGDTIVAIDGADLADLRATDAGKQSPSDLLLAQMANVDPGETVSLRVLAQNGEEREVTVEAREASPRAFYDMLGSEYRRFPSPAPGGQPFVVVGNPWFGFGTPWAQMQLVALTPELGAYFGASRGLLVVRGPESDGLRLQDGDVILDIGGREPTTPEHALRILGSFQGGETMKITVMRNQRRETLEFQMPADSDD